MVQLCDARALCGPPAGFKLPDHLAACPAWWPWRQGAASCAQPGHVQLASYCGGVLMWHADPPCAVLCCAAACREERDAWMAAITAAKVGTGMNVNRQRGAAQHMHSRSIAHAQQKHSSGQLLGAPTLEQPALLPAMLSASAVAAAACSLVHLDLHMRAPVRAHLPFPPAVPCQQPPPLHRRRWSAMAVPATAAAPAASCASQCHRSQTRCVRA